MGCRLFDRLGRSIKPTSQAEILYPKAQSILEDIYNLEEEITHLDKKISGELVIGASTIPGAYILPHIATEFKNRHPDISFKISIADSAEITDSVLNHDLLLGIVGAKSVSDNLNISAFVDDELVLVAAAERKIEPEVSLKTLLQLPFLLREEGSGTRKYLEDFGIRNNLDFSRLNTVAVLGSNAAIKEAVKADLGVSVLSRVSIGDELEFGKIKEITVRGAIMKRSFYVVSHKNRTLPCQYRAFMESF